MTLQHYNISVINNIKYYKCKSFLRLVSAMAGKSGFVIVVHLFFQEFAREFDQSQFTVE